MRNYVLSPEARVDLVGIWRYSAARWSDAQADRYLRLIDDVFAATARRPSLGRSCDELRLGYFRIKAESHVVFFRKMKDRNIYVVRVLHESMDFDQQL